MEISDEAKQIVQELGKAINEAVERSQEVADAIERLREAGYEMELNLRLDIGLRQLLDAEDLNSLNSEATLDLTEDDLRTLRGMKIRIDDF